MTDIDTARAKAILDRHAERLLRCVRSVLANFDGEGPSELIAARDALAEYVDFRSRAFISDRPSVPPPRTGPPANVYFAKATEIAKEPWIAPRRASK